MTGGQATGSVEVFRDAAMLRARRITAFVCVIGGTLSILSTDKKIAGAPLVLCIAAIVAILASALAFALRAGRECVAVVGDHVEVRTAFRTRSIARTDITAVTLRTGRSGDTPQLALEGAFRTVRPRSVVGLNAYRRSARARQKARFVAMGERLAQAIGVPFKNEYQTGSD